MYAVSEPGHAGPWSEEIVWLDDDVGVVVCGGKVVAAVVPLTVLNDMKRHDHACCSMTAGGDDEHTGIVAVCRPKDPGSLVVPGGLPADEMHATLAYYGKIPDVEADLRPRLETFLRDAPTDPFVAKVGGVARMGNDDPQAVALLVEAPEFDDLRQRLINQAVPDLTHPHFTPHVTIGYGVDIPDEYPDEIEFDEPELWWGSDRRKQRDLAGFHNSVVAAVSTRPRLYERLLRLL